MGVHEDGEMSGDNGKGDVCEPACAGRVEVESARYRRHRCHNSTDPSLFIPLRPLRPSLLPESFFFQAEDGIRDFHVTGVQTCALPISSVTSEAPRRTAYQCRCSTFS